MYFGTCIPVYTVMGRHILKYSPFKLQGILIRPTKITNFGT